MRLKSIILSFLILLLFSCGANVIVTKQEAFPKMYNEQPLSILVLPPLNSTTSALAKEYYLTTIAEPLSQSGFYVAPIVIVNQIMKDEGIDDSSEFLSLDPAIFNQYFGSDAILFTDIVQWDTNYSVIAGSVTVQISFLLKSSYTGEILWSYNEAVTVDTSGDNNVGGGVGLLLALVETAVKTAVQDYIPIAKQVNNIAISTVPLGQYHPRHNADQEDSGVNKNKISK